MCVKTSPRVLVRSGLLDFRLTSSFPTFNTPQDNMDKILASCPQLDTLALRLSSYRLPPIDEAAVRRYMNDGKSNLRRLVIGNELWEVRAANRL